MATWREALKRYRDMREPDRQKLEDGVSKAVLRGLGWKPQSLAVMEAMLGIDATRVSDEVLIERVTRVLTLVSGGRVDPSRDDAEWGLEVRWTDGRHDMVDRGIDEIAGLANSRSRGLLIFGRVDGIARYVCYIACKAGMEPDAVRWPRTLLVARELDISVYCRDLEDTVRRMAEEEKWDIPRV